MVRRMRSYTVTNEVDCGRVSVVRSGNTNLLTTESISASSMDSSKSRSTLRFNHVINYPVPNVAYVKLYVGCSCSYVLHVLQPCIILFQKRDDI